MEYELVFTVFLNVADFFPLRNISVVELWEHLKKFCQNKKQKEF